MALSKRFYWIGALVAVFALAAAAVTLTSRMTFAGGSDGTPSASCQDKPGDDANENESLSAPDAGQNDAECAADANEPEDGNADDSAASEAANAGKIDDGADLLPQASITLDQAITAAQSAASGSVGEIDLEQYKGKLVFNVDVGDKDVKVDAATGAVLAADAND